MPKKPTSYTPAKDKSSPLQKSVTPMKDASIKPMSMPKSGVTSLPKVGSIGKPTPLVPRTPRI